MTALTHSQRTKEKARSNICFHAVTAARVNKLSDLKHCGIFSVLCFDAIVRLTVHGIEHQTSFVLLFEWFVDCQSQAENVTMQGHGNFSGIFLFDVPSVMTLSCILIAFNR